MSGRAALSCCLQSWELHSAVCRTELYEPFDKIEAVKGREIILWSLSPADQLYASVLLQKKLRGLELSIIIVSHGVAMRSCVMDDEKVTDVDLRKLPVNGKFVIVFTERAGHIIGVIAGRVLL